MTTHDARDKLPVRVARATRAGAVCLPPRRVPLCSGAHVKILLVSHNFPPHGAAGTELYTAEIGERLARRGHGVHVFTSAKDIAEPDLVRRERTWRGVTVHEVFNNLYYRSFRETWDHPEVERHFGEVCDVFAPDVVHFQHLMYLSAGCLTRARATAAVVFTLHDYWLQCPRFGQRVHADGGVCHTIDYARCGTCLSSFKFTQSRMERTMGGMIAGVRRATGVNLAPIARGAAARLARVQGTGSGHGGTDAERADALAHAARTRADELRARACRDVDLFLAPSRFLREKLVREFGLPGERVEHLRLGVDLAARARPRRAGRDKLRVAFAGTLTPHKGAHVLLEAWARLAPERRARAELVIFGPGHHDPAYQVRLAALAKSAGARLGGQLAREAVAAELAGTDLLVVPSLWYENSPLVILEALAVRTPLLVSDQGGMAELVEGGRTGFHFRMGDVSDLAHKLDDLLAHPSRLARLYASPPRIPTVDEHVDELEERYRRLARARAP